MLTPNLGLIRIFSFITIFWLGCQFDNIVAQNSAPQAFQDGFQIIIDEYLEANSITGISASISLDGLGDWQGVSGISHENVLMDTSFLLGIASNTKLFTSVICLKMIEHGYFTLDDPLSSWLADYPNINPSITVRQLLQHNSGVSDYINNISLFPGEIMNNPNRVWEPEEILAQIGEPWAEPGETILYSNTNYILAAMVLEEATQGRYIDLVRDSIFEPLGLDKIYFEGFEDINGTLCHPWFFGTDYSTIPRTALGTITWSAGSLVSKPRILNRWYSSLFTTDFLSDESKVELMNFVEWPDEPLGMLMGLGVYKIPHNNRIYYGHGGRTIGYSSFTLFDEECGHSISIVMNQFFADARTLALELAEKACELANMETGIDDPSILKNQISISPNPADSEIRISFNSSEINASKISLIDLSGNIIASNDIRNGNQVTFFTQGLPSGLYMVRINTEVGIINKKVLILH